MLLQYLSMNLLVQRYVQTDGEALMQAMDIYVDHLTNGNETEANAFVQDCLRRKHLLNAHLTLGNTEGREFAVQLHRLREYMGHTTAFNSKWIKCHVIRIYGGVSD